MDFIKKHYEKILLALALLVLIGAAAYLAYSASKLSEEVQEAPRRPKPRGKTAQTGDIATYTNAIASLQTPPLWDASPANTRWRSIWWSSSSHIFASSKGARLSTWN